MCSRNSCGYTILLTVYWSVDFFGTCLANNFQNQVFQQKDLEVSGNTAFILWKENLVNPMVIVNHFFDCVHHLIIHDWWKSTSLFIMNKFFCLFELLSPLVLFIYGSWYHLHKQFCRNGDEMSGISSHRPRCLSQKEISTWFYLIKNLQWHVSIHKKKSDYTYSLVGFGIDQLFSIYH